MAKKVDRRNSRDDFLVGKIPRHPGGPSEDQENDKRVQQEFFQGFPNGSGVQGKKRREARTRPSPAKVRENPALRNVCIRIMPNGAPPGKTRNTYPFDLRGPEARRGKSRSYFSKVFMMVKAVRRAAPVRTMKTTVRVMLA
jgi:hypothetical protein